jgi:putative transposase
LKPAQRKALAGALQKTYGVSIRRSCAVMRLSLTGWYYRHRRPIMDAPLRQRMCEIAQVRVRYGARRIHVLLRREGWAVNHKRVHRIYVQAGLNLRAKRPRRRKAAAARMDRPILTAPNQLWSMDFVADALFNGQRFRALTIVDNFTRECLAIELACSLRGDDVVAALDQLRLRGGCPARIQVDNGPEFISMVLDRYAYEHGITLDYSRPGKPTDNPFIESFNGSLRDECLNTHWFLSLADAREKIESWRTDYNHFRPHSSLADMSPVQFAEAFRKDSNPPAAPL